MEKWFGEHAADVAQVFTFFMGKPHKVMAYAYILLLMNIILTSFKGKSFHIVDHFEKIFAYTMFIILGNIIDAIAVNAMFEWEGSTQFLICLYIISKEAAVIKNYLTAKYHINIPILNERLGQIEQKTEDHDPNTLNARIDTLRRELEDLEQQKQEIPVEEEK